MSIITFAAMVYSSWLVCLALSVWFNNTTLNKFDNLFYTVLLKWFEWCRIALVVKSLTAGRKLGTTKESFRGFNKVSST